MFVDSITVFPGALFYQHGLILFQAWIGNCIPSKTSDGIIHSPTSTVARWSLGMDKRFYSTLYDGREYL